MQHATIKGIELKKAKSGAKGIVITILTDDQWIRDWIGENAPAKVSNRWWEAAGIQPQGWDGLMSHAGFDLINVGVSVTLKEGDYGTQVDEVYTLNSGVQDPAKEESAGAEDDDELPF